jgi:hypothetical protein
MEVIAMRDFNGIYVPSRFEELSAEFNAEVPDWKNRLQDFDNHENGNIVWSTDIENADFIGTPIANWSAFLAIETELNGV